MFFDDLRRSRVDEVAPLDLDAVSKSTCAPSTAAAMMLVGRVVAPFNCLRRLAGNAGRFMRELGFDGVPPGIL